MSNGSVNLNDVRWGDIYLCDLGAYENSIQSGIRPVLIIQNNVGNLHSSTTIVAPITRTIKRMHLPSHVLLDPSCGLTNPSVVMLEQMRVVEKTILIKYMGELRDETAIEAVKNAILAELGITEIRPPRGMALCDQCYNEYAKDRTTSIRRFDLRQTKKSLCSVCQRKYGYSYIINRKQPLKF